MCLRPAICRAPTRRLLRTLQKQSSVSCYARGEILTNVCYRSVLYRRLEPEDALSPVPEDTLFQLVTDDTFQWEENLIWESLGSVDGADSSFFTSDLRRTRMEGDAVRNEEEVQQQAPSNVYDAAE